MTSPQAKIVNGVELKEVCAHRRARFVVVAAKVPNVCIVRCQAFTYPPLDKDIAQMVEMVSQVVGRLNPDITWSWFDYGCLPTYAEFDDVPRPPIGVYSYKWIPPHPDSLLKTSDLYERDGEKIEWVGWPQGWIK